MASYCRWKVSATAEVTQPRETGGHQAFTTFHEDIGRTLGGGGSIVWLENQADGDWANGVNTEELAQSTTGNEILISPSDLIFIKHSGFADIAHTTANTTDLLHFDSTSNPTGTVTYFKLAAGESMVIPRLNAAMYVHSSGNNISVQWVELT